MQTVWINRSPAAQAQRGVIVFAAGWAGSDELVRHVALPQKYDFLCLFDYRALPSAAEAEELFALLAPYRERHLAAWSFGVWAATRIFDNSPWAWDSATAINGTPIPVSDAYGIPERAFAVTVRSIGAAGTAKFLERMCGTPESLREYCKHRSTRPLDEIYDELVSLGRQAAADSLLRPERGFWTGAVIGGRDAIFPPGNLSAYWEAARVPVTLVEDMPHYPLHVPGILTAPIPR